MKITALLLSLILSNVSPSLIKNLDHSLINNDSYNSSSIALRACITKNIVLNKLNSSLLEEELEKIKQTRRNITLSNNPDILCGVNITQNQKTGGVTFEYNLIPKKYCLMQNDIICYQDTNCTNALKCCDEKLPICTNAIIIKPINTNTMANLSDETCSYSNQTACYNLKQIDISNLIPTPKNADVPTLSKTNAINSIYVALVSLFMNVNRAR